MGMTMPKKIHVHYEVKENSESASVTAADWVASAAETAVRAAGSCEDRDLRG